MLRLIFSLCLNTVNCNLFMIFSKLIKYFLTSLTISFTTWWSLTSSINWFIVSFNHFRFINLMLFLTRFWHFSALVIKTSKFCHALFWWAADEYCAQILISRTNSTAKFFKQLCYCNIKSYIALNLWSITLLSETTRHHASTATKIENVITSKTI